MLMWLPLIVRLSGFLLVVVVKGSCVSVSVPFGEVVLVVCVIVSFVIDNVTFVDSVTVVVVTVLSPSFFVFFLISVLVICGGFGGRFSVGNESGNCLFGPERRR
eukprot:Lithocolla_globosa_v1_NODE_4598_length_1405_cov_9.676558.p4 type:complete len:104 gc:universal NODE_4598_length_1405_cov_9.676558:639-950(+)